MFERYTERARRVIFFARYETSRVGSSTIETEHLLLGLIREDKPLTVRFLQDSSAIESIQKQIEARTTNREKVSTSIDLPLSDECKRILAYSAEEAERLNHRHIGTEHLLLGILREDKSLAAEILGQQGMRLDAIREELSRYGHEGAFYDAARPYDAIPVERMVPDEATAKLIARAVWLPAFGAEVAGQDELPLALLKFTIWQVTAGPLFAFIRMTDGKIVAMGKRSEGTDV